MMELLKIEEFAQTKAGGTPSTTVSEYWKNGNIPWLNSGALNQGVVKSTSKFITKLGLEESSTKLMPPDTILIALTGATTGVIGYLTFEACANQSVVGILPSKRHFPKYLYYYLNLIRQKVLKDASGTAQPGINQKYVKNIQIPIPPLDEQKHIVAKLDSCFEAIDKAHANVEKNLNNAKELFKSNLQLAIGGEITKEWRKNNPHIEHSNKTIERIISVRNRLVKNKKLKYSKLIKNSKSFKHESRLPKNWCWVKANEILFVTKLAGFEYTKHINLQSEGEIPVIRAQNVRPIHMERVFEKASG